MKYVDIVIQTLLVLAGAVVLIYTYDESDWYAGLLLVQLLLGPWQLLSSLISVLARAHFLKWKLIHLISSCLYLLFLFTQSKPELSFFELTINRTPGVFTVPAWFLAIYYYVITWKCVFVKRRKPGSFLPNLSF